MYRRLIALIYLNCCTQQENTKRKEELDVLSKAKTKSDKEKHDMETKLNEIKTEFDELQKEVHCQVQLPVLIHVLHYPRNS